MSTDEPGDGGALHRVHPHPHHEGEYEEKDVSDTQADVPVGEYPDTDVVEPRRTQPDDEGEFPDHDVVSEHRHPEAEGSFEDAEIPGGDEDVEAVQVERAHQHDDLDTSHTPAERPDLT